MYGSPQNVEGECNDIGDDYGTMRCQLPKGHEGKHQQKYDHNGGEVVVTWEVVTWEGDDSGEL